MQVSCLDTIPKKRLIAARGFPQVPQQNYLFNNDGLLLFSILYSLEFIYII